MFEQFRVQPGKPVRLTDFDANGKTYFPGSKEEAKDQFKPLNKKLRDLQTLLYAQGKHNLLLVLQGMDTSGKDSTTRRVFKGVNPQGVNIANFKVPTPKELSHDYLWRVHQQTPGKGEIKIFNRSHYEDVLVVRVHSLAPEERWSKRYHHISEFERLLADEGTTVIKFFLHISNEKQRKKLISRRDTPRKQWKFNPNDLSDRALWPDFQQAYQDALNKTSTEYAPWYIVPSNQKWFRDLMVATILVEMLESFQMQYPPAPEGIEEIEVI
jgi:PPK2 family polyphosphate:nucleotide phosphotransferase